MSSPNNVYVPKGHFHSKKLNAVSRKIVQLAFTMGGSPGKYFRAQKCNYVFADGEPCFNEKVSDHNIDCPLCSGKGAYFDDPIEIPIIVSDSVDNIDVDKYGVRLEDVVTLSVPNSIDPRALKVSRKGQMHTVKDKFAVYDVEGRQWGIFTMIAESFDPYLAGTLYRVLPVVSQYTKGDDSYGDPKIYFNVDERDLLSEINKDIYGINTGTSADKSDTQIEAAYVPLVTEIDTSDLETVSITTLEDDWR